MASNPETKPIEANQLRLINFELVDIYFPMFNIQINWDVFPLRNRFYMNQDQREKQAKINNDFIEG